ncbi:MAG: alpha/beta fold hydrolase, partial [Planctomycetes bacterium]|nr:alpha/beta fold hydrolase [Planctomycetota bacterium]
MLAELRNALLVGLLALTPACSISSRLLVPRSEWLVEPDELGLAFEDFELETGKHTSVHGWFVPSPASDGRTVVLCHGNGANISFYHPYYRFLHDAGYHVVLFDYRGYGKSRGELSVDALFSDTERVLEHVFARGDVDPRRVFLYGTSLGAIVALRSAAVHPELAGIVVEDASSPHAHLKRATGGFLTFWLELFVLPGRLEATENASALEFPALFLCGAWDPALVQHLQAAEAAGGPTASWVQPRTGHAPDGLLEHDGEYQAGVARFLDAACAGRCPRVEARFVADDSRAVELTRVDFDDHGPLPVEICRVDTDGAAHFSAVWLDGDAQRFELADPVATSHLAAWAYRSSGVRRFDDSWTQVLGPFARAQTAMQSLRSLATLAREADTPLETSRAFVDYLDEFEAANGPLVLQAQTELIPDFFSVAELLAASEDEGDRALARRMYRRCMDAEPPIHGAHYWPDSAYRAGFVFRGFRVSCG